LRGITRFAQPAAGGPFPAPPARCPSPRPPRLLNLHCVLRLTVFGGEATLSGHGDTSRGLRSTTPLDLCDARRRRRTTTAHLPFRRLLPFVDHFSDLPPERRSHRRRPSEFFIQVIPAFRATGDMLFDSEHFGLGKCFSRRSSPFRRLTGGPRLYCAPFRLAYRGLSGACSPERVGVRGRPPSGLTARHSVSYVTSASASATRSTTLFQTPANKTPRRIDLPPCKTGTEQGAAAANKG